MSTQTTAITNTLFNKLKNKLAVGVAVSLAAAAILSGCTGTDGAASVQQDIAPLQVIDSTDASTETDTEGLETESFETESFEIKETERISEDSAAETETLTETQADANTETATEYRFRSKKTLESHFEKHGGEFNGQYKTAKEYEAGASAVANSPEAMHKTEAEDGDDVYYIERTNEFVIVSTDGYLRTYFKPSAGIKYYNKQ